MTTTSPYGHIRDVKEANERGGYSWFSKGAMEFFHTRIETRLYRGRYFVTSECREPTTYVDAQGKTQPPTERRYSLRFAEDDGDITTIGEFMGYSTITAVMDALFRHDLDRDKEASNDHRTTVGGQPT